MLAPTATATIVALITGAAAIAKKYIARKPTPKSDHITRAEFHEGLDKIHDRITTTHLALTDRLDSIHRDVLSAVDRLAATTERRLDVVESTLARLDERTLSSALRTPPTSSN